MPPAPRSAHDAAATRRSYRFLVWSSVGVWAVFTGIATAEIAKAIPYVDPEGRIDAASVADQIAWYKSQNLMKADIDGSQLIDSRYALTKVAGK